MIDKKKIVYVLKRCEKDNKSCGGFVYPLKKGSVVEAKDWKPTRECGNGLHGWTKCFDTYFDQFLKGNFVVLEVNKKDGFVELKDKVKFRKGKIVINTPDFSKAHKFMLEKYPEMTLHWNVSNQGDKSTSNQGDESTSNQGDESTSNQGDWSTSNQGDWSTSNQGDLSTSNQGCKSTSNQGYKSTSNQGYKSISTIQGDECIYRNASNLGCCVLFYNFKMKIIKSIPKTSLYIIDMKVKYKYTTTPENIKTLKKHEIIVFGSNLNGNHVGGLAKVCKDKFGAQEGAGEGLTGQCYSFPTLDKNMKKVSLKDFEKSIDTFIKVANENTMKIFFVTKLGCGIAGFNEEEIKELWNKRNDVSANIILPQGWRKQDD
jgi:hypothetical protein